MVKIQIISDLHLEFMKKLPKFLKYFKNKDCDYLFLAGDIGYPNYPKYNQGLFYQFISWCTDNYKKVFYVCGNHEAYKTDMNLVKQSIYKICEEKTNFIFLEKGIISNIEEYKVIGCTLWSDISKDSFNKMNDKYNIKINGLNLEIDDIIKMHLEDKIWLENNVDSNTIVMTHHLPSLNLIHPNFKKKEFEIYNSGYASNLDNILYNSKIWIYGHTHKASDIMFDGITRCICNPYGYYNDDDKYSGFTIYPFEI
jgi:predicted phosphodiesterase